MCNPCFEEYVLAAGKAINLKRKRVQAFEPEPIAQKKAKNGDQTSAHPVSSVHASDVRTETGLEPVPGPTG